MCRPTKRPKAIVAAPSVAAEQTEAQEMMQQQQFEIKDVSEMFAPFPDILEDSAPSDLLEAWSSSSNSSEIGSPSETVSSPVSSDWEARPKTFVYTTFDMVNNPENAPAVGFSADGLALEIRNLDLLSEKILPKYFRHKNVTSFYRQLNSYGFRTTRSASGDIAHTFSHENFRQGRPDLLPTIVRKKCVPKDKNAKDRIRMKKAITATSETSCESAQVMGSPSDTINVLPVDSEKTQEQPDVMKMIEELRQSQLKAQERALALEARNKQMAEENRAILMESEMIFKTMNRMVESQTYAIEKLFGTEASRAFAEQAKPFRFEVDETSSTPNQVEITKPMQAPQVQAQAQEFRESVGDSNDFVFQDDELQMLENIFANDSEILV